VVIPPRIAVALMLMGQGRGSTGSGMDEPLPTVVAGSYVKRPGGAIPLGMVAAFLAQHNNHRGAEPSDGRDVAQPLSSLTTKGAQQQVVIATLGRAEAEGARRVAAFLLKYYGTDQDPRLDERCTRTPRRTASGSSRSRSRARATPSSTSACACLTPRERFTAQGFPPEYQIETGVGQNGEPVSMTSEVQGRCCGNSVCPPLAAALVAANCGDLAARPMVHAAE
jgi:DNA (cytosine-5)-methyltransferase 1